MTVSFSCPECRNSLQSAPHGLTCKNGHRFSRLADRVYDLLPSTVDPLSIDDAAYHASQREIWLELNQVRSYRNVAAHQVVMAAIAGRRNVLEIGGGVGFDLDLFLQSRQEFDSYVFSDISADLAAHVAQTRARNGLTFCAIDAHHLPFHDSSLDCVYMIAALHHLENMPAAVSEMVRVLKPGGILCCGIEPNTLWQRLIAGTRGLWRRMLPTGAHSPADEEAHGVTIQSLRAIASAHRLNIVALQPVWFLCGFLHYGLEFIYRLLRLKRRIVLPTSIERLCVAVDALLLRLPGMKHLSWHYTVSYEKLK